MGTFCTAFQAFIDIAGILERLFCDAGHLDRTYDLNAAGRHQNLGTHMRIPLDYVSFLIEATGTSR